VDATAADPSSRGHVYDLAYDCVNKGDVSNAQTISLGIE